MIDSPEALLSRPPRLSMDEYADFVEASLRERDPIHAMRQKEIEKRIELPFRLPDAAIMEQLADAVGEEWMEWYRLTPAERWRESAQLWEAYLAMGGSLDPEPDTQSPFFVLPA